MRRHLEDRSIKRHQKPFPTDKKNIFFLYILLFQQLTGVTLYCFLLMQHFFLFFSFPLNQDSIQHRQICHGNITEQQQQQDEALS